MKELNVANHAILELKGGINNRVYRCGSRNNAYVIKGYPKCQHNTRDRMRSEVEFLRFAGEVAKEFVPHLIQVDWERHCVVLEYINGISFTEGCVPDNTDIVMASEFFIRLNSNRPKAEQLITMNAAEGYLSLTQHIENVSIRIRKMRTEHLPVSHQSAATQLIKKIKDVYEIMENKTLRQIRSGTFNNDIGSQSLCISPSDFGFHNAIRTQSGIKFFDFEFSGWDDPAKTIADFVLQPRVPIENTPSQLIKLLQPDQVNLITERCATLGPILRIKWLCIILSVLNPARLNQITQVNSSIDVKGFIDRQLSTATKYLEKRDPFGLH